MRLTKKQREQVVELLRCAADRTLMRSGEITLSGPFAIASRGVDDRAVNDEAWRARAASMRDLFGPDGDVIDMPNDDYQTCLLEAAQRVEEGTWP